MKLIALILITFSSLTFAEEISFSSLVKAPKALSRLKISPECQLVQSEGNLKYNPKCTFFNLFWTDADTGIMTYEEIISNKDHCTIKIFETSQGRVHFFLLPMKRNGNQYLIAKYDPELSKDFTLKNIEAFTYEIYSYNITTKKLTINSMNFSFTPFANKKVKAGEIALEDAPNAIKSEIKDSLVKHAELFRTCDKGQ